MQPGLPAGWLVGQEASILPSSQSIRSSNKFFNVNHVTEHTYLCGDRFSVSNVTIHVTFHKTHVALCCGHMPCPFLPPAPTVNLWQKFAVVWSSGPCWIYCCEASLSERARKKVHRHLGSQKMAFGGKLSAREMKTV